MIKEYISMTLEKDAIAYREYRLSSHLGKIIHQLADNDFAWVSNSVTKSSGIDILSNIFSFKLGKKQYESP